MSWQPVAAETTLHEELSDMDGGETVQTDEFHIGGADIPVEKHVFGGATLDSNVDLGSSTDDEHFVSVRYEGDLTIESGNTLSVDARKLGLGILVEGDLTLSGTINMSRKGANHSESGSDIPPMSILVAGDIDTKGDDVIIPATGADGGVEVRTSGTTSGVTGSAGTNGQTGGGGSGGSSSGGGSNFIQTGHGARGTAFSGGTGSGAARAEGDFGNASRAADSLGGGGSDAQGDDSDGVGGGAGNPGGSGDGGGSSGDNGTGGLLIVIVEGDVEIQSDGVLEADGADGGDGGSPGAGGGGSGGGSVNVYHSGTFTNNGTIRADGGNGGSAESNGGDGGSGTTRVIEL